MDAHKSFPYKNYWVKFGITSINAEENQSW